MSYSKKGRKMLKWSVGDSDKKEGKKKKKAVRIMNMHTAIAHCRRKVASGFGV